MRITTTNTWGPPQPRKTTSCGKGACGKPWHTSANKPQESQGTRASTMARPSELWELSGLQPRTQVPWANSRKYLRLACRIYFPPPPHSYSDLSRRSGMRDARMKGPPGAELPSRARVQLRNNRKGVQRDPTNADHNIHYQAMVAPNCLPCARGATAAHTLLGGSRRALFD